MWKASTWRAGYGWEFLHHYEFVACCCCRLCLLAAPSAMHHDSPQPTTTTTTIQLLSPVFQFHIPCAKWPSACLTVSDLLLSVNLMQDRVATTKLASSHHCLAPQLYAFSQFEKHQSGALDVSTSVLRSLAVILAPARPSVASTRSSSKFPVDSALVVVVVGVMETINPNYPFQTPHLHDQEDNNNTKPPSMPVPRFCQNEPDSFPHAMPLVQSSTRTGSRFSFCHKSLTVDGTLSVTPRLPRRPLALDEIMAKRDSRHTSTVRQYWEPRSMCLSRTPCSKSHRRIVTALLSRLLVESPSKSQVVSGLPPSQSRNSNFHCIMAQNLEKKKKQYNCGAVPWR
ncbi:uncharacterized protein CLUP02_07736 [Colletotrichum lupini]|uniref:Uncharacterized protein n=1 Tax=Colletotrichum lupini TaxID=145971 RepID=A0A9Q8SRK0_9PEZI|nr:uncharacterized protein CLUP02_07736 [Colletotrichum lupini]UQC82249.1 hypothetical protein CLUP02_07736 [Colletotrichum lupini]